MRLAIFTQMPMSYHNGKWYCSDGTYGNYIDGLASHFETVTVVAREFDRQVNKRRHEMNLDAGYAFKSPNLRIIPLPDHSAISPTLIQTFMKHKRTWFVLWRSKDAWDVQYIWMPGITSFMAWSVAVLSRKPYFIYVRGHWEGVANTLRRWHGWRDWLFSRGASLASKLQQMAISRSPFRLWEGDVLYKNFLDDGKPNISLSTARMSESWFTTRIDTCQSTPIRLISIGKLVVRKGNQYLLEAVAELRRQGLDIELWLVGDGEQRNELEALVVKLGLSGKVTFYGQVQRDPGVIELCRKADIYVLPSLSEGFPRALTEAASQSLPIVATAVGAIPQRIQSGEQALIIPPGRVPELVNAIRRIIDDEELRQHLIQHARSWATELEKAENDAVEQTIDIIAQYYPDLVVSPAS